MENHLNIERITWLLLSSFAQVSCSGISFMLHIPATARSHDYF